MFGIGHWEILLILMCMMAPVGIGATVVLVLLATRQRAAPSGTNLVPCPDCGRGLSPLATNCPNCGRPLKQT